MTDEYTLKIIDNHRSKAKQLSPGSRVRVTKHIPSIQLWTVPFSEEDRLVAELGPELPSGTYAIVISLLVIDDSLVNTRPWVLLLANDGQMGWCRVLDRLIVKR